MLNPIPRLPPVTTATLPSMFGCMRSSFLGQNRASTILIHHHCWLDRRTRVHLTLLSPAPIVARWSFRAHRRLRLLLLIGILIVSGLTVSSFLARQRLRRAFRPLPPAIAAGVDQQTQSFSLSKSLGGQALYKIQAKEVTNFKDTGKTLLHDVTIEVYGKQGNRQDHITSQECEFDPATGSLFFPGKVEMDLQAAARDGRHGKPAAIGSYSRGDLGAQLQSKQRHRGDGQRGSVPLHGRRGHFSRRHIRAAGTDDYPESASPLQALEIRRRRYGAARHAAPGGFG